MFILILTLQEVIHTIKGLPVFKNSQFNGIFKSEKKVHKKRT